MATAQDNELLTRVGPGTPMGELMRQYWLPACKASEVVADGDPLRLMLLGEKLIAFRDSDGRVGVMDHRCPHRGASLFYGRNEEGGIRCVYHGWKFGVGGQCLDMPNVPADRRFGDRVRAKAYPAIEQAGVVWTYMGPLETPPPPPSIEATLQSVEETRITLTQRECNWLQALEGDLDTGHFGFLHMGSVDPDHVDQDNMHAYSISHRAPEFKVLDTAWGTMAGAHRPGGAETEYWRICHFLFPFWALFPDGTIEDNISADAWVPMDDTHTMYFNFSWTRRTPPLRTTKDGQTIPGLEFRHDYLPQTTDWHGRFRLASNADKDYGIDREAQRTTSFTGITGITLQDQYITESMGEIVDRTIEHLTPGDLMIVRTRQRLMKAARALAEQGVVPPGVEDPEIALQARSGAYLAREGADWLAAYREKLLGAVSPGNRFRVEFPAE